MAKKAAHAAPVPEPIKKSRKLKRKLIVIIVLLIVVIAALVVVFGFILRDSAEQSQTDAASSTTDTELISDGTKTDAVTPVEVKTEVPKLIGLLGLKKDEAIKQLAHGATVTSTKDVKDDPDIKSEATITLASEPSDARTGAPQVYVTFSKDDKIVRVGYTTAMSALGYGSLSFHDVIETEHIVERVLQAAGLDVAEGTVSLPDDPKAYSTYAKDGTTLTRESMTFNGTADVSGKTVSWEAVVYYDYITANATGKLPDTVRQIYVYLK